MTDTGFALFIAWSDLSQRWYHQELCLVWECRERGPRLVATLPYAWATVSPTGPE